MVSLTLLRIWHSVAMTAAIVVLLILLWHYGKPVFFSAKVIDENENR